MTSMWQQYKVESKESALPPRTRMYIGLGGMAFAMAGLYVSDAMEDKLDPTKRQARETATLVEPATEPRK
ncbi:hypothetical protein BG006_010086 [Podila minutissima]|uniref:Uncharacterized protein n=1 Tax=Podila minutissima TaxID=64525 RepID=A0A9P5SDM3_9FUNG|nr:hypothetical protein BG006_010086 [Podila minutissima]